jgi:hypothetical protein
MMDLGTYKFHRRAFTALNQLAADEQAQVRHRLESLVDTPPDRWPATLVQTLPGDQRLYLLRVNDSLRAFVRAADGQEPEVMDIVRHETLEAFTKTAGNNGN